MPIVTPWNTAFNNTPADTDQISEGNERIQDVKLTVRDEFRVEHDVGDASWAGYTDSGRHSPGSARAYFEAPAPTTLEEPDGTACTDRAAPPSNLLDNGRLWVNWDDLQPYVREQNQVAAAWTTLNNTYGVPGSMWVSLWPRSWTDTYPATVDNERPGSGNNARDTISGISGQSITIPDDGRSYELIVKVVIKYCLTSNPTAGAFWLEETAPGAVDVDMAFVSMANATEVGGVAVLEYLYAAPTNGTIYTFNVDFASNDANNFYVNPTDTVVGVPAGPPYTPVAGTNVSRLFLTIRPKYDTTSY